MKKTIKLPILLSEDQQQIVLKYQQNQNNVIRYTYNRLRENTELSTAQITVLQKTMHNIFVDSHFKNSATYKAKTLLREEDQTVIFGGKKLFMQRCQNKVSKDEFQERKLLPLVSIGEANEKGNRKFAIISTNKILFKPTKCEHLELRLPFLKKNLKQELEKLQLLQNQKVLPITYELTSDYIYITYDDEAVNPIANYRAKAHRIIAIDLNPNYIGYSILDWQNDGQFKMVANGLFDLTYFSQKSKALKHVKWELKKIGTVGEARTEIIRNKIKHLNGQRDHETIAIAIKLFNVFKGYNCNLFGIENLDIKTKDSLKGKHYNRLTINEWLRNCLINQLEKRMDRIGTKVVKVLPNYSSFVGNIVYRDFNLPDPILSSIEINRRAYEFNAQYLAKSKPKSNVIMFPRVTLPSSADPLEGRGRILDTPSAWKRLYGVLQKARVKYRLSLEAVLNSREFSKQCIKTNVILYNFT